MKNKNKLIKKLNNDSGETLVETLASLLIITLSIALLVMTVAVCGRMITSSKESMNQYYAAGNNVAAATEVSATGTVTIGLSNGVEREASTKNNGFRSFASNGVFASSGDGVKNGSLDVDYYGNDEAGREPVAFYQLKED